MDSLANYIQKQFPGIKGFTRRGLYRMKQFYETYAGNEKVSPLVTQLSWTNHLLIMAGSKSDEEREFYIRTGASTGRNYFYDGTDGDFVYAGFLIKFSINPNKVNPKFIKYYCMSDAYKGWIRSFNSGSTRGNINAQTFGNMLIPLPSRIQQDNMVSVLSSIDDKIEINRKINENLEQQAESYFYYQFIANMDPSWQVGTISDLGTIIGGGTPSKTKAEYYTDNGIA